MTLTRTQKFLRWVLNHLDRLLHRRRIVKYVPEWLSHNVGLATDIQYGWGPLATDWNENRTAFLEWYYRWFWRDWCTDCWGDGFIDQLYPTAEIKKCRTCDGVGRLPQAYNPAYHKLSDDD